MSCLYQRLTNLAVAVVRPCLVCPIVLLVLMAFCPLFGLDFVDRVAAGSGTGPDDDDEGEEVFGLSSSSRRSASLRRWRFSSSASCPSSLPSLVPLIPAVGSADAGTAGGLGCLPLLGA